jgi:hypothetical protein
VAFEFELGIPFGLVDEDLSDKRVAIAFVVFAVDIDYLIGADAYSIGLVIIPVNFARFVNEVCFLSIGIFLGFIVVQPVRVLCPSRDANLNTE